MLPRSRRWQTQKLNMINQSTSPPDNRIHCPERFINRRLKRQPWYGTWSPYIVVMAECTLVLFSVWLGSTASTVVRQLPLFVCRHSTRHSQACELTCFIRHVNCCRAGCDGDQVYCARVPRSGMRQTPNRRRHVRRV